SVLGGLHIGPAPVLDQAHSLKLELASKLPSLHDPPPVPSKHLTRCLRNRVQAISPHSAEIASRLSNLYERWKNQDLNKGNRKDAIDTLTKSIEVFPSVKKYYDRAAVSLEFYVQSGERPKGYQLASADFARALGLARQKGTVLSQLPWLMPSLVETLIFEGRFK